MIRTETDRNRGGWGPLRYLATGLAVCLACWLSLRIVDGAHSWSISSIFYLGVGAFMVLWGIVGLIRERF